MDKQHKIKEVKCCCCFFKNKIDNPPSKTNQEKTRKHKL